jgi:hypothetical protein
VVEVVGAGFDRPSNSRYHTLRLFRVVKIHHDRSFLNAVDFTVYQPKDEQSRASNGLDAEGSHAFWLAKLGFDTVAGESDALNSLKASENERYTDSFASDGSPSEKDLKQHGIGQRVRHDTKRKASCSSSRGSELLEECAPSTISFAEWNVTELLATESGPLTDLFQRHVKAFLRIYYETVTLGTGSG